MAGIYSRVVTYCVCVTRASCLSPKDTSSALLHAQSGSGWDHRHCSHASFISLHHMVLMSTRLLSAAQRGAPLFLFRWWRDLSASQIRMVDHLVFYFLLWEIIWEITKTISQWLLIFIKWYIIQLIEKQMTRKFHCMKVIQGCVAMMSQKILPYFPTLPTFLLQVQPVQPAMFWYIIYMAILWCCYSCQKKKMYGREIRLS